MFKALIVDDLEANLEMLKSLLEGNSIAVTLARNGTQALESARSDPPDIIISDILMPVMDGFALCHDWMSDASLSKIPFIFSTATYTEPKDEALGLSLGALRYIVKPIDPEKFVAIIRGILSAHEAGTLSIQAPAISEEVVYYRLYNEALIRRLEAKMINLEKMNNELDKDIAARKNVERKLQEANQELEKRVTARTAHIETMRKDMESFSYSVSHDLRAPLRAILGFSEVLAEKSAAALDEEGKALLSKIQASAMNMNRLISSLLDLAMVASKPINITNVDMGASAEKAFLEVTEGLAETYEFVKGEMPEAKGDPVLLHQVWVNLISNAAKFSKKSAIKRIEVGGNIIGDENVYFVYDSGVGFDQQYADKLFKVFQRLHSTQKFEGIGIGLALVHRIIDCHQGREWAEGKVDEGAKFYFALNRNFIPGLN
jgi:two-component system sensor histidine kinase/response regulator